MRKNACEAIPADGPDRTACGNPRAAAEFETLRANNKRKDAEVGGLGAENDP